MSERQQIAEFVLKEAHERYGRHGHGEIAEALERIAQLILRGRHLSAR